MRTSIIQEGASTITLVNVFTVDPKETLSRSGPLWTVPPALARTLPPPGRSN